MKLLVVDLEWWRVAWLGHRTDKTLARLVRLGRERGKDDRTP